jgi:hypothetical protein
MKGFTERRNDHGTLKCSKKWHLYYQIGTRGRPLTGADKYLFKSISVDISRKRSMASVHIFKSHDF